jgi:hypothetical protein
MYQDILNLNKTTKSILKNPDTKNSLAYSNSILRKDPGRVNVEGIGLNPNVPLEDEYIQNLQKQIHFMDLEIKLMKEKSQQEEALGGNYQFAKIGLADGKHSVDHIMTATNKLKTMKLDLTKQTNLVEQDLLKKREENTIAQAKAANLEKHVKDYDEKLGKILAENSVAINQIRTKLLGEKTQKEDVEIEVTKLKKALDKVLDDNAKLRKETELRKIHQEITNKAFEQDEAYDGENAAAKIKLIDELQFEKAQLFMVTEKNPRLQALREENEELQKKVKESEKRLANTNYKVLETETLQALSVKKKEEDQEMRKKLQSELDKWKDQFDETLKSNELKIERKLREAESAHIKELQADLLKEKHELIELQNKLHAIDKKEAEYIIDQSNRMRQKVDLDGKKKINEEMRKVLLDEVQLIDPSVNDLEDKVGKLRLQNIEAREARAKLHKDLMEVEEQNIILLSKFQFLQNNIKLDEDMKKFNVDELRNVIQTNQTVNQTIEDFMGKWENLRKFSKMP